MFLTAKKPKEEDGRCPHCVRAGNAARRLCVKCQAGLMNKPILGRKGVWLAAFALCVLLLATSCIFPGDPGGDAQDPQGGPPGTDAGSSAPQSTLPIDERMMEYINSRYDESFEFYGRKSGIYSSVQFNILVTSAKYPGELINVLYAVEDGVEIFNDNYLYFVYREQTEALLGSILTDAFSHDFKLFYGMDPPVGVNTVPGDASFYEYISNDASWIMFTAVLAPGYGDGTNLIERLREGFAAYGMIVVNATVYLADDEGVYDGLTDDTLESFLFAYNGERLRILETGTDKEVFEWRE